MAGQHLRAFNALRESNLMATPAKKQPKLSAYGWKIPFFGKLTKRSPLRNKDMNVLVQCLNALGAMEIREGKTNAVLFSDNNVVIQIKRGGGGAGGGGGASPPVWL